MTDQVSISIRNLYKIFGSNPQEALKKVYNGASKHDLMTQHRHVLGLSDINVDMHAGKITVIMGLFGKIDTDPPRQPVDRADCG
jgi:glycine betaine/proline transport system ATP-binding protein